MEAKRRRPNFTDEEMLVILMEVTARKTIIQGKLDGTRVTKQTKNAAWEAVKEALQAVGPVQRTTDEVRKKYYDFRSIVKRKLSQTRMEMGRTGGGQTTVPHLSATEEAMAALIPDVAVDGLAEVLDSEEVPGASMEEELQDCHEDPIFVVEHDYSLTSQTSSQGAASGTTPNSISTNVSTTTTTTTADLPVPNSATDGRPSTSRGSRYPRTRTDPLAPEMLKVQEDIRDDVNRCATSLENMSTSLATLVKTLQDLAYGKLTC